MTAGANRRVRQGRRGDSEAAAAGRHCRVRRCDRAALSRCHHPLPHRPGHAPLLHPRCRRLHHQTARTPARERSLEQHAPRPRGSHHRRAAQTPDLGLARLSLPPLHFVLAAHQLLDPRRRGGCSRSVRTEHAGWEQEAPAMKCQGLCLLASVPGCE